MIGAIIGDAIGERYEFDNIRTKDFPFEMTQPTDDSIMTLAVADAIIKWDEENRPSYSRLSQLSIESMRKWGKLYPDAGYGGHFNQWLVNEDMDAYNSCGNGSAMRISPVGWASRSLEECIQMSKAITEVTHNHPDGIKGAEATAVQIFLARQGMDIKALEAYEKEHYYRYSYTMKDLSERYKWHSLCNGTCQPAYQALYESTGFEDSIRNAISIGGDSDTIAAITGSIAQVVWGIPEEIRQKALDILDSRQKKTLYAFEQKYMNKN